MDGWIFTHNIDSVLLPIWGTFAIRWYSLMYLLTFFSGYWYYQRQSRRPDSPVTQDEVSTLLIFGVFGVILGGRLGWVIFYGGMPYLENPLRVFQVWEGGLSFHGGLLGVTLAIVLFSRHIRQPILTLGDFIVPWVPVGVLLVRIGNFINSELYGKPTDGSWGVIFPTDPQRLPRHPSQLYEAFGEGVIVLIVLMWLRRVKRPGIQPAAFMLIYGCARFAVEFVRLPDRNLGCLSRYFEFVRLAEADKNMSCWEWGSVSMGQVLSMPLILIGGAWLIWIFSRPKANAPA